MYYTNGFDFLWYVLKTVVQIRSKDGGPDDGQSHQSSPTSIQRGFGAACRKMGRIPDDDDAQGGQYHEGGREHSLPNGYCVLTICTSGEGGAWDTAECGTRECGVGRALGDAGTVSRQEVGAASLSELASIGNFRWGSGEDVETHVPLSGV